MKRGVDVYHGNLSLIQGIHGGTHYIYQCSQRSGGLAGLCEGTAKSFGWVGTAGDGGEEHE